MPTVITGTDGINQVQAGAVESGDLPAGSVIQVVYARPTFSNTTVSGLTYQDTGLDASITPISTTSKILVQWVIHIRATDTDDSNGASFRIVRNGTGVTSDTPDFIGFTNELTASTVDAVDMFLDSPSTTSAVTYKVQVRNRNNASVHLHINGLADPSMVLMEVAG